MTGPIQSSTRSSRLIPVTNLNPKEFAPFGQVIQNPATHGDLPALQHVTANQGSATKWLDVTNLTNHYELGSSGKSAKAVVNMFVCEPRQLKQRDGKHVFPIEILERHPLTPQTFIPLGQNADDKKTCYLVIVAPTLPARTWDEGKTRQPAYPTPDSRPKRSLKERLFGARPNPFTNDFATTTTPSTSKDLAEAKPKGPGPPDPSNIKAFIARGDQAVTYGPGTWHAPMVVLGEKSIEFVVVQYSNGVALEDCQEIEVKVDSNGEGLAVEIGDGGMVEGSAKAKL